MKKVSCMCCGKKKAHGIPYTLCANCHKIIENFLKAKLNYENVLMSTRGLKKMPEFKSGLDDVDLSLDIIAENIYEIEKKLEWTKNNLMNIQQVVKYEKNCCYNNKNGDERMKASVVGITFCDIKNHMDVWRQIKTGTELMMEREPTNPKDPNAVKVSIKNIHIGYVEKDFAVDLSKKMKDHDVTHRICTVVAIRSSPLDKPILVVEY